MENKILQNITSTKAIVILFILSISYFLFNIAVHVNSILHPKAFYNYDFFMIYFPFVFMFLITGCTVIIYMNNYNEKPFIKRVYEHTTVFPIILFQLLSTYTAIVILILNILLKGKNYFRNEFCNKIIEIFSKFVKVDLLSDNSIMVTIFSSVLVLMTVFTIPALYSEIIRRKINTK